MTSIEKLRIQGIRSFAPNKPQTIAFEKPLTLIVGKNGSGKTTIIECLKMATTGNLPPHVSGQQFINDPNLHSVPETKAQIKLKLTAPRSRSEGGARGRSVAPMVCVRSFSLAQKANRKEYKAIESALKTIDDKGEEQCLSYRCADLNKLLPELMGVSPAVLESVIFVHQEDSCWPLAEDKVLKEKFDSIFASEKFTKALDELRRSKNELKNEVKVELANLATVEEKLKTVNRLREEQEAGVATAAEFEASIEACNRAIADIGHRITPLEATRGQRDELRSQLQQMDTGIRSLQDRSAQSRAKIREAFGRELEESDADLKAVQDELGSFTYRTQEEIRRLDEQIRSIGLETEYAEQHKDTVQATLASREAEERQHEALQAESASLVRRLSLDFGLPDTQAEAALEGLSRQLLERQEELRLEKQRWGETIGRTATELHELKAKISAALAESTDKEREAEALERKKNDLSEHIKQLEHDEHRMAQLQEELATHRERLQQADANVNTNGSGAEIQSLKPRVRQLKDSVRRLKEEHDAADAEGDRRARIARLAQQAESSGARLAQAISERKPRLEAVLGATADLRLLVDSGRLSRELQRVCSEREKLCVDKQQELQLLNTRVQQREASLEVKTSTLRTRAQEATQLEEDLRRVEPTILLGSGYDFETEFTRIAADLQTAREGLGANKALLSVLSKAADRAEAQRKCSVCDQDCDEHVVARIRQKHRMFEQRAQDPEHDRKLQREIGELETREREIRKAEEQWRRLTHIRNVELPVGEKDAKMQKEDLARLKGELTAKHEELDKLKAEAAEARELRSDASFLDTLHEAHHKDLTESEAVRSGAQSAMAHQVRDKEEVKREWDAEHEELERAERRLDFLEKSLRHLVEEQQELQHKRNSTELELARLEGEMARKRGLKEQRDELAERQRRLVEEAALARTAEQPLRETQRKLDSDLHRHRAQEAELVASKEERVAACQTELVGLKAVAEKLRAYETRGGADRLQAARALAEAARSDLERLRTELKARRADIDETRAALQKKETYALEISNNLELRQLRASVSDEEERRREVSAQIGRLPHIDTVDADLRSCYGEQRQKQLEVEKMKGALDTVNSRLHETRAQLRQRGYARADEEHAKKLIEVKTLQLSVKDIDAYEKALARALIKFHQAKMEDINRSVKELWNKTYQGTDIDGIEIYSEHHGETASGNRKISYRVVMRKGDTTLDMRGRCSAGQKVLACLVIRLALAESFCLNCGILALDEPTTNLDKANSESFAQALNEVIKHRRQQDNFQLIVITHDDAFVEMLGRSENANKYYRVSKAFDGGVPYSVIDQVDIQRFG